MCTGINYFNLNVPIRIKTVRNVTKHYDTDFISTLEYGIKKEGRGLMRKH